MQLEDEVPSREVQTCGSVSSGNQERGKRWDKSRRICTRVFRDREVYLLRVGVTTKEDIPQTSVGRPLKNT